MTWNDGSVYEGDFDRGTRHGRGELRLSDGFIYSGAWDNNYMEGRGMSIFPDGQEYQVSHFVINLFSLFTFRYSLFFKIYFKGYF